MGAVKKEPEIVIENKPEIEEEIKEDESDTAS